jgi:hypothetical protein
MATKPVTTVPQWAATTNYTIGPDIGTPTKVDSTAVAPEGHVAGVSNPTAAQNQNDWQFKVSKDCAWVEAGSSLGAADAHIIETDSQGKTSVRKLTVIGDSGISGASLDVTRGASLTPAAKFTDTTFSVTDIGGPSAAIEIDNSGRTGIIVNTTGNHVAMQMVPQLTRPTTFVSKDGSIGFEAVAQSGTDATAFYAVVDNAKCGVPYYVQQWVYQLGDSPGGATFNGDSTSPTSIISTFDFAQFKAPLDAGISMLYEITFEASSVGGLDFWVRFRNNGTTVRDFYIDGGGTSTIKQISLRGVYTGAGALLTNSFDLVGFKLTGAAGGNNIVVDHALVTIHTAL